ncbi:gastrula zinc finger protein XlCGF67.1-like [Bicyclus anynana]|uniref:Gastrula zinc finger protein XlCGF67.1-like n=1 Tax=Bicyclus anynana TaxID=110368 RepID=A0A6J1NHY0_BICAN|nr:gastrula zinc finger protein XlCGF67.1-like [Bicyclus anynana]
MIYYRNFIFSGKLSCLKIENIDTATEICKKFEVCDQRKENIERPQKIMTKDGKKYIVCDICKKNIAFASWRRHSQSHLTVKRYSCHTCGLGFNDSGNLSRHRKALHADHRPHTCSVCHKSFSRNSHLKEHTKTHSDNRDYICDMCGKASKSSAALRMHRKIHLNEYRFSCIYCDARFKRRGELVVHVSVHTGEKAHVCACGKAFRLRSQLNNHTRLHIKELQAMKQDLE